MICRPWTAADGSPGWLLIEQLERARLSGDLADAWRLDDCGCALVSTEVRYAARHHDDGWPVWDQQPGLDPRSGRPLEFNEMPLAESLAIWNRSIDAAAAHTPLAGFLVAGHFTRLLQRFTSWQGDNQREPLALAFLDAQAVQMAGLLAAWQARDHRRHSLSRAELGVSFVQQFDALSLWLCCAERTQPWIVDIAPGGPWTFAPVASGEAPPPSAVRVRPWPLAVDQFELSVWGRAVPQAAYRTTAELLAARSQPIELTWTLRPAAD